jgi:hypothetical protein
MTYGGLAYGERFFPDKLKADLSVKKEGLPVFHHYADPESIDLLFCGIFFRCLEKPPADTLTQKVRKKVHRGDVEAILIPVEEKSCVTGYVIILLCNETLHERVVEHAE